MRIQELFGHNVRIFREKQGWSQERLAEKSGFHRTYVSGIELGKRNPTISVANKIAESLDVPVANLFHKKEPQQ